MLFTGASKLDREGNGTCGLREALIGSQAQVFVEQGNVDAARVGLDDRVITYIEFGRSLHTPPL